MIRLRWFLALALAFGAAGLTYSASEVANATESQEGIADDDDAYADEDGNAATGDNAKGDKSKKGKGKKGKKHKKGKGKPKDE
jgi:hypothetical protein